MRALLLALAVVVLALPALAQAKPVYAPKPQVIEIDPDVIVGRDLRQPDVVVTPHKQQAAFRSLIQIRKSFTRELLASAQQLPTGSP